MIILINRLQVENNKKNKSNWKIKNYHQNRQNYPNLKIMKINKKKKIK